MFHPGKSISYKKLGRTSRSQTRKKMEEQTKKTREREQEREQERELREPEFVSERRFPNIHESRGQSRCLQFPLKFSVLSEEQLNSSVSRDIANDCGACSLHLLNNVSRREALDLSMQQQSVGDRKRNEGVVTPDELKICTFEYLFDKYIKGGLNSEMALFEFIDTGEHLEFIQKIYDFFCKELQNNYGSMIGFRNNNEIGHFVVIAKIHNRIIDEIHIDTELVIFDNQQKIYAIGLEGISHYIWNENYSSVWIVHSEKKTVGSVTDGIGKKARASGKKKKTKNRIFKK